MSRLLVLVIILAAAFWMSCSSPSVIVGRTDSSAVMVLYDQVSRRAFFSPGVILNELGNKNLKFQCVDDLYIRVLGNCFIKKIDHSGHYILK